MRGLKCSLCVLMMTVPSYLTQEREREGERKRKYGVEMQRERGE